MELERQRQQADERDAARLVREEHERVDARLGDDSSRTTTDALPYMSTAHERPIQPSGERRARPRLGRRPAAAVRERERRRREAEAEAADRERRAPHVALELRSRADRVGRVRRRGLPGLLSTFERLCVKAEEAQPDFRSDVEGDSVTDDNAGESAGEPPRLNMGFVGCLPNSLSPRR